MRTVVLVAALVFIVGFAALTVYSVGAGGFGVLTVVSLLILAMFALGIVGALRSPPPGD